MTADALGFIESVTVSVQERGGGVPWVSLQPNAAGGSLTVRESGTNTAKFTVPRIGDQAQTTTSGVCDKDLQGIRTWNAEGVVSVNGLEAVTGPIVDIDRRRSAVVLEVNDFTAWWQKRFVQDSTYTDADPTRALSLIHNAAMAEDTSPNFGVQVHRISGLKWSGATATADYTQLADVLKAITDSGVSWIARGRTVFVRGPETDSESFALSDQHFVNDLSVKERGKVKANRVIVVGKNSGPDGPWVAMAEDRGSIAVDGLLERRFTDTSLDGLDAVTTAARDRLTILKNPVTVEVPSGSQLSHVAPVSLAGLTPGNIGRITSTSTGAAVSGLFRVSELKMDFGGPISATFDPVADEGLAA